MSGYWKHRKQKMDEEGHIDDWLMTYADMITLLLCFFAVFLAISVPEESKFEQAKQKVQAQFSGDAFNMRGKFPLPPTPHDNTPNSDTLNDALPSIVDRYQGEQTEKQDKRDRITTIDMNSSTFFERGSAQLNEEGRAFLAELAPSLTGRKYRNYMITVEGYTDDIPIQTPQFPSNWELSTARSAAVVRMLIEQGIPPQRLRAVGYADSAPKVPNRDADGNAIPENQAQNRRVVIKLEKIDKAK